MILVEGSLLEHEFPFRVEYPNRKCPVEESELMRPHFFFFANRTVVFIDEDDVS